MTGSTVHPVMPADVTSYDTTAPPSAVAGEDGVKGEAGSVTAVVGDHVTVCTARLTVKVTSRDPAAYDAFAAALARTVHEPSPESVNTLVAESTVQPVAPADVTAYDTAAPPSAVAAGSVTGESGTVIEVVGAHAIVCVPCATVNTRDAVPVPAALIAPMVEVKVPPDVGVPEISPLEVLTFRPAGRLDALKLVGELVPEIVYVAILTPTVALCVSVESTTGVTGGLVIVKLYTY